MVRHGPTDAEWEVVRPLLPDGTGRRGRPWRDHRRLLDAMFWILKTGSPWRDLPAEFGPWLTVFSRFQRWRADGTLARGAAELRDRLGRSGRIDWSLFCVDGTNVRAAKAAAGTKAPKGRRSASRRTTPRA
jgi:transposase